ncbi:MAG: hypothetical protein FWD23_05770 [Oscillospiraceae bacterium]|nr:hypothetical protein [Oscillospiraceae bacterium]
MGKKIIIGILALILVGMNTVGCSLFSAYNDYSTYSSAFKKTFDTDSMELTTGVKASLDGGTEISSTGTFKLKGMKGTPQFINIMTISGQTVTQFCDGEFVYTDDGASKNKMKLGQSSEPQPQQQKQNAEFSYDSYISEFSSLIDAGKIKEMSSLEPIAEKYVDKITATDANGGKQFDVVMLPAIVDELKSKFLNESSTNQNSPTVDVDAITYSATVKDGYVVQIVFNFKLSITAPGDDAAKKATVDLTLKPVNPGQEVSFDLPSTDGF